MYELNMQKHVWISKSFWVKEDQKKKKKYLLQNSI